MTMTFTMVEGMAEGSVSFMQGTVFVYGNTSDPANAWLLGQSALQVKQLLYEPADVLAETPADLLLYNDIGVSQYPKTIDALRELFIHWQQVGLLTAKTLVLFSSVHFTVSEALSVFSLGGNIEEKRLVGISYLGAYTGNNGIELFGYHTEAVKEALLLFQSLQPTVLPNEVVGFVFPRILAMLVNEAHFAKMEGIASDNDMDTAMTLGTNYPQGLLAWGEQQIGLPTILAILKLLHRVYGEERYRPCALLQQRVIAAGR